MTYGCAQDMSIYDNLSSIYLDNPKFTKGVFVNQKVLDQYVKDCIKEFEIACDSEKSPVRMLSGGNIQKVIVAREFTSGANIIIANQPTRGIDVGSKEEIYKLIDDFAKAGGAAIIISSEMPELLALSDRIIVLAEGHKTGEFSREEADEAKLMNKMIEYHRV